MFEEAVPSRFTVLPTGTVCAGPAFATGITSRLVIVTGLAALLGREPSLEEVSAALQGYELGCELNAGHCGVCGVELPPGDNTDHWLVDADNAPAGCVNKPSTVTADRKELSTFKLT
jgi:hypothetical protein